MMTFVRTGVLLLDGQTGTGTGTVREVLSYDNPTVQVEGMVTNDIVQIEGSNDGLDVAEGDSDWVQIGDDITEDGIYAIEPGVVKIRANFSDNSGGGTVTAKLAGRASG